MKRILTLLSISVLAAVAACDDGSTELINGGGTSGTRGPTQVPGDNGDFTHNDSPSAPGSGEDTVDPAQVRAVGSPEVVSRLHGCGKLTVASIGQLLQSRGLTGQGTKPPNTQSGQQIFAAGDTAAALGGPNYNARVGEAPFSTTAAVSKMFDIYTMASYDAVSPTWTAPACPDVKVIGDDGKFTKDGISCLIGKPATEEHVAIANDAITKSPTDGAKIAIAALLAAAHTCQ